MSKLSLFWPKLQENNGSPLKSLLISHSLWRFERNLRTGDQDQRLEQIELLPKNHASPSKKCVNLSKNSFKRNSTSEKWNWSHLENCLDRKSKVLCCNPFILLVRSQFFCVENDDGWWCTILVPSRKISLTGFHVKFGQSFVPEAT